MGDLSAGDAGLSVGGLDCVSDVLTREQAYRWNLAVADGTTALVSPRTAAAIMGTHLTWLVAAAPGLVVPTAKLQGLYDRDDLVIRKSTWSELPKLVALTGIATMIGCAARGQLIGGQSSRAGFFLALWSLALLTKVTGPVLARRPPNTVSIVSSRRRTTAQAKG